MTRTPQKKIGAQLAIIGGGIIGCACAYYLARRGIKVTLLDRSVIGGESSGGNSGGIRQQGRDPRERSLAMASAKLWEKLGAELDYDLEYVQGGNIQPAINEIEMERHRALQEKELADGLAVEVWDRDELRRRAPYVAPIFLGAKYCAKDGVANPIIATRAFGWAAKRAGATILPHAKVVHIAVEAGHVTSVTAKSVEGEIVVEAPTVIHSSGVWTPELSRDLGLTVPIEVVRHVVAVTQRVRPLFSEYIDVKLYGDIAEPALVTSTGRLGEEQGLGVRPDREGHIHIGGVSTFGTFDQSVPADALEYLARGAAMVIPALRGTSILRAWARPLEYTPDRLPIIGPVRGIDGYILAAGFSGHGFCLGPIVGKVVSELIVDGAPSMPLDEFRFSRFEEPTFRPLDEKTFRRA